MLTRLTSAILMLAYCYKEIKLLRCIGVVIHDIMKLSFKNEILLSTIGLAVVTVVATTFIGVFSTTSAGDYAEKSTRTVLQGQARNLLLQISSSAANREDLVFENVRREAESVANYIVETDNAPATFNAHSYWNFNERVIQENGILTNSPSDVSTFHIPSFVNLGTVEKKNIEQSALLDFLIPGILKNNKEIVAMYLIDTLGITRYYPNIVLGKLAPPEYDPRLDIYYAPATPQNNPDKHLIWSPLYEDVAGRGLMVTLTTPIYLHNRFSGIMGTDILLTSIIERITNYTPIEGSYTFLIDKEGNTIAFSDQAAKDILGPESVGGRVNLFEKAQDKKFKNILKEMTSGQVGFGIFSANTETLYISYAPLEQTGFSLAVVVKESIILKAVETLHHEISNSIQRTIFFLTIPAGIIILFLASLIGGYLVVQRVKEEIAVKEKIQGLANELSETNWQLARSNEQLRIVDQRKSEFVSIVSHQLRTPITAIKGYASLLLEDSYGKLTKEQEGPIDKIFASSKRLADMVSDFLDISKIEQGKMTYTFTSVDLHAMLTDLTDEFRKEAKEKKLKLTFTRPEKTSFIVTADDGKIRQIFSNIIDNSIKYTPKGEVTVSLEKNDTQGTVIARVKDSGIGLSQDDIHHLFGKFTRGSGGQKEHTAGSGLGLYVAKKMLEAQHGKIWIDSEGPGKGSTFAVELLAEEEV